MGSTHQRNAPSLPPELWAKAFAHLEQRPDRLDADTASVHSDQEKVHRLKLVCKQFRSIYECHSDLVQRLYLDTHFSVALLPSLLAWLHQNKGSLRLFWSECRSPLVDIVMAGISPAPNVNTVDVVDVSACTVSLTGTYKRLEKCTLAHLASEHVGLAPLGALPKLRQLGLQGNFGQLHHLTGLTRLECMSGCVLGAQELSSALQYLGITDSDLVGVHAQTLPACTALAHLVLDNASLKGKNAYVYLDRDLSVVPTNMGQLTQLQSLHLFTDLGEEEEPAELGWVSELTSLQELGMSFNYGNANNVLQHVSMLTKLTYLAITGFDVLNACLDMNVEWRTLRALRKLCIHNKSLCLGDQIYCLLHSPNLQEVSFKGSVLNGPDDMHCFDALISKVARLRPQVKLLYTDGIWDIGY